MSVVLRSRPQERLKTPRVARLHPWIPVQGALRPKVYRRPWLSDETESQSTPAGMGLALDDDAALAHAEDIYPAVSSSTPARAVQNWGLGEVNLITVQHSMEPLFAPCSVTVHFDLRPLASMQAAGSYAYLAILDAEKLRARVGGSSLDAAVEASESWIARTCICSSSGKLLPLTIVNRPGQVRVRLSPMPLLDDPDTSVLMRVVLIADLCDPQDWQGVGAVVVMPVEMAPRPLSKPGCSMQLHTLIQNSTDLTPGVAKDERPAFNGIALQQLAEFHREIKKDLDSYCACHRICTTGHRRGEHVCIHDPCPYGTSPPDDHRGLPFVPHYVLEEEERGRLQDLVADVKLVARRYAGLGACVATGAQAALAAAFAEVGVYRIPGAAWAPAAGGGTAAELLRPPRLGKPGTYIAHCWSEPFSDLLDTLQRALRPDDIVLLPGLLAPAEGEEGEPPWSTNRKDNAGGPEERRRWLAARRALRACKRLLVVADVAGAFTRCQQCLHEIRWAQKLNLPTLLWLHQLVDLQQLINAAELLPLQPIMAVPSKPRAADEDSDSCGSSKEADDERFVSLKECIQHRISGFVVALEELSHERRWQLDRLQPKLAEQERMLVIKEVRCIQTRKECILQDGVREKTRAKATVQSQLQEVRSARSQIGEGQEAKLRTFVQAEIDELQHVEELETRVKELQLKLYKKKELLLHLRNPGSQPKKTSLWTNVQKAAMTLK